MKFYIYENSLYKETDKKEFFKLNKKVDFIPNGAIRINRSKYYELINFYYKDKKELWEYQGERFRNLFNFQSLEEYHKLPIHKDLGFDYRKVYHNGRVYASYSDDRLQLFSLEGNFIKRTSFKNCSPIFNITKKEIC